MPRPQFECRDTDRLLSPEFLDYPELHDMGRIAISSNDIPGEYDVSVTLLGCHERGGVVNAYDDLNLVVTSAESYRNIRLDPLLLGIFSLEMHLRGTGQILEAIDYEDNALRQRALSPYGALFGNLYQIEHPHPDDMYVAVDLQSDAVIASLTATVPTLLHAQKSQLDNL